MILAEHIKQFIRKYYPREHLYFAGVLVMLFMLLFMVPDTVSSRTDSLQNDLPIPVSSTPKRNKKATDPQLVLSDYIVEDDFVNGDLVEFAHDGPTFGTEPELADISDWQNIEVRSGDNLSAIFTKVGLSNQDLFRVLNSSDEAKILNRVYPGYQLDFNIPDKGQLQALRVFKSPLEGFVFTRNQDSYQVETIVKQPDVQQTFKVGTIDDSLFMAGQREQIPAVTIMEMADIFGGVIDFILDPRPGDQFSILYEEKYLDGEFIGNGDILASQFIIQGKVYTAVRYINTDGDSGYYNPEGESMRKAFLRNPLDVFRISSNFNPNRRHPILNTIRAHKGTDYAAPTGTPIRATSDGKVTRASRNGSFGNLVVIQHSGSFETKYAHLSKYGPGIKRGVKVRQGDIIGYVGTTGSATGPHLHYEFLVGGVHQNPRTILDKLPQSVSIEPAEMDSFKSATADLLQQFNTLNAPLQYSLHQPSAD